MPWEEIVARLAASGARSTALKAVLSLDALLLAATLGSCSSWSHAPAWLTGLFAGLFVLSFFVTIWAYIYFMFKDPDSLRSERFSLRKMEIERGIVGDSGVGIIVESTPGKRSIEAIRPLPLDHNGDAG